uniref:Uncharacterized protein n=1 Tax=Neogobius melanostomus TaxID=47308 RepID=A0A8C6TGX4_9GOBI
SASPNVRSDFEEQFRCSICLEVFSEPVSTPCGHNFCKQCIILHWDTNALCFCPLCNEVFTIRPELRTNTPLSGTVSQFTLEAERQSKKVSKPGDVQCSVCSEPKLKAQRRLKVQKIRAALDQTQREADRETQQMVKVFSDIMESAQRCLDHHLEVMEQSLSKYKERAQALIQQLQQEMCELEKSSTEAQQLSLSTDPLHFLQRCPALPPAGLTDWSNVSFESQTCEGSVVRALSELETRLSQEFDKVFEQLPKKDQLRRVQQFLVDVTLDPDTAHPNLILSEDLKQVHHTDVKNKHPNTSQRFTKCCNVLGKQSFSSGRFYFEVQEEISLSPKNGYWTMALRNRDQYIALANSPVILSLWRPPQKVGVFVDYGAGLVSFYDVDSADLIYSFTGCRFKWRLLPFFGPWLNNGGRNSHIKLFFYLCL